MTWHTAALLGASLWLNAPDTQISVCRATVRQIDTQRFPEVRISVLVTDSSGNPLAASGGLHMRVIENGREVESRHVDGFPVYVVLAIDRSGSMGDAETLANGKEDALAKAKEAAIAYMDAAPRSFKVALVSFADSATVDLDFTSDRAMLRDRIERLEARGATALQDGIGKSLELLWQKEGRRAVLVLTDGKEQPGRSGGGSVQYPGPEGAETLLRNALAQEVSISSIGVGEADTVALSRFTATRGRLLYAYGPDELRSLFLQSVGDLKKEQVIEYYSTLPSNGRPASIQVLVDATDVGPCSAPVEEPVVVPGMIPHVKGNVLPFGTVLLTLLVIPVLVTFSGSVRSARRFRKQNIHRIQRGSPYLGMRDGNGLVLEVGHPIILCPDPDCRHPHHVRSWRFNRCRCMWKAHGSEVSGSNSYCYSRTLPVWLRKSLDLLTSGRETDTGRTWQCRCAGDDEGF